MVQKPLFHQKYAKTAQRNRFQHRFDIVFTEIFRIDIVSPVRIWPNLHAKRSMNNEILHLIKQAVPPPAISELGLELVKNKKEFQIARIFLHQCHFAQLHIEYN